MSDGNKTNKNQGTTPTLSTKDPIKKTLTFNDEALERRDKDYLNTMSLEARKQWMRLIIDRMCQAWGFKSRSALAQHLGYNHKAHTNWVKLTNVPHHVVYTCHVETGVSLDWLYNGTVSIKKAADDNEQYLIAKAEEVLDMSVTVNQIAQLQPGSTNAVARALVTELIKVMADGDNKDEKAP